MKYQIIVTQNKVKKMRLHRCNTEPTAIRKFQDITKSNKVLFPQRYVNSRGIKEVKYEILLMKEREENDVNRMSRDELGRLIEERTNNEKWVIINKKQFFVEEKFLVFGYQGRLTAKDIIKDIVMKKPANLKDHKQVIYALNKVIIQDSLNFDIIVCKNVDDAMRLHNTLQEFCQRYKQKVLFQGKASPKVRSEIWKKIHEVTGWKYDQIWRSSTRP